MATSVGEPTFTYEELADLEREFDDVETETLRRQVEMTKDLYARRQTTIARIPNFWRLVLEQAPPDIDQFVQPSDSELLMSSLTALSVTHLEPEVDPRSVAIRWEFSDNKWFEACVLEKRFWWRRARDGWGGLVSEPVAIKWRKGHDLTSGLLDLVAKVWEQEQRLGRKRDKAERTAEQKALKKKMENTGLGALSFFAWFGYVGRRVSAEEDRLARAQDQARRKARLEGGQKAGNGNGETVEEKNGGKDDDDHDELENDLEIFPDGDELAIAISQDLWPSAIKYFTQAMEEDGVSDDDFESDDEGDDAGADEVDGLDDGGGPPAKRRKS